MLIAFLLSLSVLTQVEQVIDTKNINYDRYAPKQRVEIERYSRKKDQYFRVGTYNILFDRYDDKMEKKHRWPQRLPRVVSLIKNMGCDVIGLQEPYQHQMEDLEKHLGSLYAFVPLDGAPGKEVNPLLISKKRFEVIESREWPLRVKNSRLEDKNKRLLLVQIKDKRTGQELFIGNVHFSFQRVAHREEEALMLNRYMRKVFHREKLPLIIVGDFNLFPNRPDMKRFPFLDGDVVESHVLGNSFRDARVAALLGHVGPTGSYTNNPGETEDRHPAPVTGVGTTWLMLDRIFISPRITPIMHATISDRIDGEFPSDHLPVICDLLVDH